MQSAARSFVSSSSHPRSRKEFFKVSNAALQSNIGWRWWSSSSAVSSNSFTPQGGQKRVPKQQRRAMILAFVEKYRALNAGTFPTASFAKKQLGGCYYVIRGIIQELEYNHKRASPEIQKEVKLTLHENAKYVDDFKQTVCKEYAAHARVEKHSSKKIKLVNETSGMSDEACSDHRIDIVAPKHVAPSRDSNRSRKNKDSGLDNKHVPCSPSASTSVIPQTDTPFKTSDAEKAGSKVFAKLESKKGTLHTPSEEIKIGGKGLRSATKLQDSYSPERNQIRNQEVLRSDELNIAKGQKDEQRAPSAKTSNFWGNLKSMADGIIKLWKKT